MSKEYVVQTGKIMKTIDGNVVLNKQYAFDYDGENANIVMKNNKDMHQYKLSNKNIDDLFTRIMKNTNMTLKDRLKQMLEKENKENKENKKNKKNKKTKKAKKAKQAIKNTKKKGKSKNEKTKKNKPKAASKTKKKYKI
jgi:hypothetical protein